MDHKLNYVKNVTNFQDLQFSYHYALISYHYAPSVLYRIFYSNVTVTQTKVVLDELYIKDFAANLDMVRRTANSKTWKIFAIGGTLSCKTHIFLHVKVLIKRKITCNFPYQLIRQQDDSD